MLIYQSLAGICCNLFNAKAALFSCSVFCSFNRCSYVLMVIEVLACTHLKIQKIGLH